MLAHQNATDAILVNRLGPSQIGLLLVGVLVLICDGFDTQMVSFIAPPLTAEWGVAKQAMAPIFAANLTGLMVGAVIMTPLADMFSRKTVTMACVGGFGVLSLMTLLTSSLFQFGIMRLLTGLALGGAMPSMIVAASEFLPASRRARLAVLFSCAVSLGYALSGFVASAVLETHGWRTMFWIGGIAPLFLLPVLLIWLPESPAFLLRRGRRAELDRLLVRMDATVNREPVTEPRSEFPVKALFQGGQAYNTVCIWMAYFCSGATLYFLANWLPLLVTNAGYNASQGALVSSSYQMGGLLFGLIIGAMVDRHGVIALGVAILASSVAVMTTGLASGSLVGMIIAAFAAGSLVVGGQNTLNAFTGSKLYPSGIRVTGLGWALAILRLGGVLAGSFAAGLVISLNLGPSHTFLIIGMPEILGGLALFAIARRERASGSSASLSTLPESRAGSVHP